MERMGSPFEIALRAVVVASRTRWADSPVQGRVAPARRTGPAPIGRNRPCVSGPGLTPRDQTRLETPAKGAVCPHPTEENRDDPEGRRRPRPFRVRRAPPISRAPAVSQTGTGLSFTGAPSPSPTRLDFGAGTTRHGRLTRRSSSGGRGRRRTIADPTTGSRDAWGRAAPPAPGRGMPALAGLRPANWATAAPFKLRAAAGATVEFDVVYAPKMRNPSGTALLGGPAMIPWLSRVALHGTYVRLLS